MKRRALSFLLAIVMLLGMIPVTAFAEETPAPASAQQIGSYLAADLKGGTVTGDTSLSYENGAVVVDKTIAGTDTENVFDITLDVTTKDKIEQTNITEDAAAVLVIDVSGSMEGNRMTSAKRAAQAFINSFATDDPDVSRYIAIVAFSGATSEWGSIDGAYTVQGWTDASNLVVNNGQCKAISDLEANGGTNIHAGMLLAKNLLNASAVANVANKNVILLTDGSPSYGVDTTEATSTSTEVICDNGTHMTGNGYATDLRCAQHEPVENIVSALQKADIGTYAVFVGSDTVDCTQCSLNKSGAKWLDENCHFQTFPAKDLQDLTGIFEAISNLIQMQARAWQLTDPMGEYIDFVDFVGTPNIAAENAYTFEDGVLNWDLKKTAPVVGGSENAPTYTYSLTYRVQLDNLADKFVPGQYYATNGETTLTYLITTTNGDETNYKEGVAYFNIPSVKGLAADLTLNKVDTFGEPLAGAEFTLTTGNYTMTATSDAEGVVTFTGIPSGHTYTLTETKAPDGYVATVANVSAAVSFGTAAITGLTNNTVVNTSVTTDITVTKVWNDADNQDGKRPESITVRLWDGQTEYTHATVTGEGNEWTYIFEDVPMYRGGEEIVYTVTEDAVDGYNAPAIDGLVITNSRDVEQVTITATKEWVDNNDQDGIRPESVFVQLYAGTEPVLEPVELNEDNQWTTSWTVDKNAAGQEIVYSVEEIDVPADYTAEVTGDAATGFVITNTHEIYTTSVTVNKVWEDADNQDGIRPEKITVQLYVGEETYGAPVELNAANQWTYHFTNLPVNIAGSAAQYSVKEAAVEGYTVTYGELANGVITITNTHTPATDDVTVTKIWDDNNNNDGKRPESIEVTLFADGEIVETVKVTAEDEWTYTFENLPVYANGTAIVYTVEELEVEGYETTVDGFEITNTHKDETTGITVNKVWVDADNQDGIRPDAVEVTLFANGEKKETVKVTAENQWTYTFENLPVYADGVEIVYEVEETAVEGYEAEYSEIANGTITITNTHETETTEVKVAKVWEDSANQDGIRPDAIEVTLFANGEKVETVKVTAEGKWTYTFTDLAKYADGVEITYTVEETAVNGYEAAYADMKDGVIVITNTHEAATANITVNKVWDDTDDNDGIRPDAVEVTLFADGEMVETVKVTAEGKWTYTFENLPVYANGNAIAYTVEETAVEGYTAAYTDVVNGVITVTNTHEMETVEKTVTKVWNDDNNKDGVRPDSIEFVFYANGEDLGTYELTAENNWALTFIAPKYLEGEEIVYTVKEATTLADYTPSYDQSTLTITNTIIRQVQTGDSFNAGIFGGMAVISLCGIVVLLRLKKKVTE